MVEPESEPKAPFILRLGGSAISHSNKRIDFDFLREFRDLLQEQVLLGRRFAVITGGGQNYRELRDLMREKGGVESEEDLHWLGAAVNTVNAYMVRSFLGDELAESRVWKFDDVDRLAQLQYEKPIVVAGGFLAGRSSDWCALQVAKAVGATKVFDLKNIDGVYEEDPKQNQNAKYFPHLSWTKYLKIIGDPEGHEPGGHFPVDPVAAKESDSLGVSYYVLKANDFANLEQAFNGEKFRGTIIS
ncbi:MAG: hypothetical protein ACOCXP_02940 [Candidatus Dojkabacteria bacterium]